MILELRALQEFDGIKVGSNFLCNNGAFIKNNPTLFRIVESYISDTVVPDYPFYPGRLEVSTVNVIQTSAREIVLSEPIENHVVNESVETEEVVPETIEKVETKIEDHDFTAGADVSEPKPVVKRRKKKKKTKTN